MSSVWDVEGTDEFAAWFRELTAGERQSVTAVVDLLETLGPKLGFPHSSGVVTSRHPHMRELRVQHRGRPLRVLYAFDPRRTAILLVAGDKTGEGNRWYTHSVPAADRLYDEHLEELTREGLI